MDDSLKANGFPLNPYDCSSHNTLSSDELNGIIGTINNIIHALGNVPESDSINESILDLLNYVERHSISISNPGIVVKKSDNNISGLIPLPTNSDNNTQILVWDNNNMNLKYITPSLLGSNNNDNPPATGAIIRSGTGNPNINDVAGNTGDLYIDNSTGDYYIKGNNGWEKQGNLRVPVITIKGSGSNLPSPAIGYSNNDGFIKDGVLYVYISGNFVPVGPVASNEVVRLVGAGGSSIPAGDYDTGDVYITSNGTINVYDGSQWKSAGQLNPSTVTGSTTFASLTDVSHPNPQNDGDYILTYDSNNNGGSYTLTPLQNSSYTIPNFIGVSSSYPGSPLSGDYFIKSDDKTILVYNGSDWNSVGKINLLTFKGVLQNAPLSSEEGDYYVDSNGHVLIRYNNGWVDLGQLVTTMNTNGSGSKIFICSIATPNNASNYDFNPSTTPADGDICIASDGLIYKYVSNNSQGNRWTSTGVNIKGPAGTNPFVYTCNSTTPSNEQSSSFTPNTNGNATGGRTPVNGDICIASDGKIWIYNNSLWTNLSSFSLKGSDGNSITVLSVLYAVSNSSISSNISSWNNSLPTLSPGLYLHTKVTLTDGSSFYTVAYLGLDGNSGTAPTSNDVGKYLLVVNSGGQYMQAYNNLNIRTGTYIYNTGNANNTDVGINYPLPENGELYYDTNIKKLCIGDYNGKRWIDKDGWTVLRATQKENTSNYEWQSYCKHVGDTNDMPCFKDLDPINDIGYPFYNIQLKKMLYLKSIEEKNFYGPTANATTTTKYYYYIWTDNYGVTCGFSLCDNSRKKTTSPGYRFSYDFKGNTLTSSDRLIFRIYSGGGGSDKITFNLNSNTSDYEASFDFTVQDGYFPNDDNSISLFDIEGADTSSIIRLKTNKDDNPNYRPAYNYYLYKDYSISPETINANYEKVTRSYKFEFLKSTIGINNTTNNNHCLIINEIYKRRKTQ